MSEEPARPEEGEGGGEAGTEEAGQPNVAADIASEVIAEITAEPAQAGPPVESTQPTNVQELEMAEPPTEKLEATPEEIRPEAEREGDVQDGIKKEPSALAAKPGDAATVFPLADDNVMAELKAGEARAREAAKTIEALKEQLAESAKKDVMTEEDIRIMEQKQKELMDKMQEFEDITKKIQQLVGLVDVASSQLGLPQKTSVPEGGGRAVDPTMQPKGRPMDTLPKVIICGTSDIDEVPKIIVCEPTSARNGKHPLYQPS
uniref:Uncharacterized protein n=2 Tax=Lygus hesperus TaxID=30085 RepID=A0A0K8S3P2_LYGHE